MHIFSHTEKLIWYFQEKWQVQLTNQKSNQLILLISASPLVSKNFKFPQYEYYWKNLGTFSCIRYFEHHALMNTLPDGYKKTVSPHSSFSDFSQNTTIYMKLKTLYTGIALLWRMKWKFKKLLVVLLQLLKRIQKICKKLKFLKLILQSPPRWNTKLLQILLF